MATGTIEYSFIEDDHHEDEIEFQEPEPEPVPTKRAYIDREECITRPVSIPEPIPEPVKVVKSSGRSWGTTVFYALTIAVIVGMYVYMTLPLVWYAHPILSVDHVITYPLHKEAHDTRSVAYTGDASQFPIEMLVPELRMHLARNPLYIVLCSHHLLLPDTYEYYTVCVLRNPHRNEYITMINPRIIGQSEEESLYIENSVACKSPVNATRADRVVVEWSEAPNRIYTLLDRRSSVDMQLVLDEQQGKIHCGHKK